MNALGAPGSQAGDVLDGVTTAALFAHGKASAEELLDDAIARADRVNPELNAIIGRLDESARERARQLDKAREEENESLVGDVKRKLGGLAGVPFLTKDLTCTTAGQAYHAGNALLKEQGNVAGTTSHLATMFAELGLVNFGRTNTPEFGLTITTEPSAYGPSANPWSTDHSTGGSSGGSAAAVAAGIVPIAHANDGGGSIRIPAANCGLFGLKPSRGRVSLGPDLGDSWAGFSIDGALSRGVRDSARVLDGISRPWPGDPYWAPAPCDTFEAATARKPGPLRVGICSRSAWGPTDPQCSAGADSAGSLLEELGHEVGYAAPEAMFHEDFFDHFRTVLAVCTAAMVGSMGEAAGRPLSREDVEGDTWAFVEAGRRATGAQYVASVEWCHAWTRQMAAWWADYDVLVSPVLAEPPPKLGELRDPLHGRQRLGDLLHFTPQFNVTGQPAMSVPLHWTEAGLPVGVQFVGPPAGEEMLFSLAGQLERAAPWAGRRPPVWAQGA